MKRDRAWFSKGQKLKARRVAEREDQLPLFEPPVERVPAEVRQAEFNYMPVYEGPLPFHHDDQVRTGLYFAPAHGRPLDAQRGPVTFRQAFLRDQQTREEQEQTDLQTLLRIEPPL